MLNKNRKFLSHVRWKDGFAILLGLIPAYVVINLIDQYAVNVPFWDIWNWSVKSYAQNSNDLLREFWQLSNEHRMLIPRFIDFFIANTTSLDMIPRVSVKVLLAIAIFLVLYLMYRSKATFRHSYLIAIPFSLLTFSLTYWPLWIDPRPLASHLSLLGTILSLWIISVVPKGWRALIIASFMAYISSLSFASGNIAWVVLGMSMWLVGYRELRHYVALLFLALIVLVPYSIDFLQTQSIARSIPSADLKSLIAFGLTYMGAPIAAGRHVSTIPARTLGILGILGTSIIAFGICLYTKDGLKKIIPWLGLSVWALTNGAIVALGRAALFGTPGAHVPRYAQLQTQFWIALVALIAIALTEPRLNKSRGDSNIQRGLLSFLPLGFVLLISVNYVKASLYMFEEDRFDDFTVQLTTGKGCLFWYETADDSCLELLHPHAEEVREIMPSLIQRGATFLYDEPLVFNYAKVDSMDPNSSRQGQRVIGGKLYDVIFQHPPSEVIWRVFLPRYSEKISLATSLLVDQRDEYNGPPSDGVLYRISVSSEGDQKDVLAQLVLPGESDYGFELLEIDLSEFAGHTILLTFSTRSDLNDSAHLNYDWALWLQPVLIYK